MAHYLPPAVHNEVFETIRRCFGFDFPEFDIIVAGKLRQAIADSNEIAITINSTKRVADYYFDADAFSKTHEHKLLYAHISVIFKAAYVLLLSYQISPQELFTSVDQLLEAYPEFRNENPNELRLLLNFRNVMKVALMIIPARLNKEKLLKIAGRLEGGALSGDYITGGGQKKEVDRRVSIYEKEGGCSARKRAERKRKTVGMDDSASSTESTESTDSVCVGQPLGSGDGRWVNPATSSATTAQPGNVTLLPGQSADMQSKVMVNAQLLRDSNTGENYFHRPMQYSRISSH